MTQLCEHQGVPSDVSAASQTRASGVLQTSALQWHARCREACRLLGAASPCSAVLSVYWTAQIFGAKIKTYSIANLIQWTKCKACNQILAENKI